MAGRPMPIPARERPTMRSGHRPPLDPTLRVPATGGIALAALALLASTGCREPETQAAPPPPTVGVVEARRMTVPVVATPTGTTRALKEVVIRARVRGFLTERHFEEGAFVEKGQLLFVIEEDEYQVALESAQAGLAEAEAELLRAEQSKRREVATAQLALQARVEHASAQERAAWANIPEAFGASPGRAAFVAKTAAAHLILFGFAGLAFGQAAGKDQEARMCHHCIGRA